MARRQDTSGTATKHRERRSRDGVRANVSSTGVKSVLLVVSDPSHGHERQIEAALRSAGYRVTVANDIAQAHGLCDGHLFDLLISSAGSVDETGWALTNDVRASCGGRGMILSQGGLSPMARRALEAGYGLYVADGLDENSFLRCVHDLLR